MSLPPGFLEELRTRTSLAQVVGRKVMWDQRKSNQGKGDMWSPCPFHQEKTASFHVDDRKGFYYCFGCHAKGDAIAFVRETENVSFVEAVEILAREAGMQVPKRDPRAQEKADHRTRLADVMEQAVQHYRLQLKTAAAADARDYLAARGFDAAALDRWEIGFAPDVWQGLWDHLKSKNVEDDLILAAGLAKPSQKGGKPYDTFRGRIMFPIRDARGRAIAFGGRAMDPDDNAKYLNSPETELFDKGRSLYNHGPAREAAGKGQPLVVAEGYMDVIALAEAGFAASVAPLGTAITEDQLRLMWRIHPEPVIALDGDTAGLRAAMRVIDLALPLLEAGQSLRFAIMPQGLDPDDLIKKHGAGAMRERLENALPMVHLLWRRETEGKVVDSPERRAALDKALRDAIQRIKDRSIRAHYGEEINRLRKELFRPDRQNPYRGMQKKFAAKGASPALKNSALASEAAGDPVVLREAAILAVLIANPDLIDSYFGQLEELTCVDQGNEAVRQALLRFDPAHGDRGEVILHLVGKTALENLMKQKHVAVLPPVRSPGNEDMARSTLQQEFAKLAVERGAEREIADAVADMEAQADEGLTWRLQQVAKAREEAMKNRSDDKTTFETGDNGAHIDVEEKDAFASVLAKIRFSKE